MKIIFIIYWTKSLLNASKSKLRINPLISNSVFMNSSSGICGISSGTGSGMTGSVCCTRSRIPGSRRLLSSRSNTLQRSRDS
ncbi:MAG: hypothetical protein [Circoviridae sp.]|nr:MAG: hypothetical protein [Circoviridae sp.]